MSQTHYTVGEVAQLYETADWRVRKIVDGLKAEIPRAGQYRLIPRALLPEIAIALLERGWLPEVAKEPA